MLKKLETRMVNWDLMVKMENLVEEDKQVKHL